MKFFLDTANIDDIKYWSQLGIIDGVTTNPSIIAQSGRIMSEVITEICHISPTIQSVSAEVVATDCDSMVKEGLHLAKISRYVTIKVPLTQDGLQACYQLSQQDIDVNVTLCFSVNQAIMAAKAGARYVSPFVGRLDDIGYNGMGLIVDIKQAFEHYDFVTEILAASIRHTQHLTDCALVGADIATVPPAVLNKAIQHPLTDKGLESFMQDWKKTGQNIL